MTDSLPAIETWWFDLPKPGQRRIQASPEHLTSDDVVAIAQAGGITTGAYFPEVSTGPASFNLSESDLEWIRGLKPPTSEFGFWDPEKRWNETSEEW